MIFSVFCWPSARLGKRKPVVSPAAAAAPVSFVNFLRVIFFPWWSDMGTLLSESETGGGGRLMILPRVAPASSRRSVETRGAPAGSRRHTNYFTGYPNVLSEPAISSSVTGSSIVGGTTYVVPSAIFLIVPRTIFPERVFGRRFTTAAVLNDATGPIRSRTRLTISLRSG